MKLDEGTSSENKTIGELKENKVFEINNKNEHLITLNKNQVIINSESLNDEHNTFLIDTGADLNIIKLAAETLYQLRGRHTQSGTYTTANRTRC